MLMYCIPGGGTPAVTFFKWTGRLGKDIDIKVLEYPGRGTRKQEPKAVSVEDIALDMYETISTQTEDFMLLSSCTGSQIAYEICRLINRYGTKQPGHMIIFSAEAPCSRLYCSGKYISEENFDIICSSYRSFFERSGFSDAENIAKDRTRELIELSRGQNEIVLPKDKSIAVSFEQEMMLDFADNTIAMIAEDWQLAGKYCSQNNANEMIRCPLTIIYGKSDRSYNNENINSWKALAGNGFETVTTDGGHDLILESTQKCIALAKEICQKYV